MGWWKKFRKVVEQSPESVSHVDEIITKHSKTLPKVIQKWVGTLSIVALNAAVLVAAFPMQAPIVIPTIILLFFSLYSFYPLIIKQRKILVVRSRHSAAFVFIVLACAWSITGPFLYYKRPHYGYFSNDFNPTAASIQKLIFSGTNYGSSSYFADPLRRWVFRFAGKVWPQHFPELKILTIASKKYIVLPIRLKFMHFEKGLFEKEKFATILVPRFSKGFNVSIKGSQLNFGPNFSVGSLVKMTYVSSDDRPPWEAIEYVSPPSHQLIRYAAALDIAIALSSVARTGESFDILNQVNSPELPEIEKARTLVLQGIFSKKLLSGNLGGLQSLAIYNRAYEELLSTNPGFYFYQRSPVANWIINELRGEYARYGDLFQDRINKLKDMSRVDKGKSNLKGVEAMERMTKAFRKREGEAEDEYGERLLSYMRSEMRSKKRSDFFGDVRDRIYSLTNEELQLELQIPADENTGKINLYVLYALQSLMLELPVLNLDKMLGGKVLREQHSREFLERIQIVRDAIEKCDPQWRSGFSRVVGSIKNQSDFTTALFAAAASSEMQKPNAEDKIELSRRIIGQFGSQLGYEWSGDFMGLVVKADADKKLLLKLELEVSSSSRWWESEYVRFFMMHVLRYMLFRSDVKNNEIQLAELLDVARLSKDNGGTGVDFIPGMVLVAALSKHHEKALRERLDKRLDAYLHAPFGEIIKVRAPRR